MEGLQQRIYRGSWYLFFFLVPLGASLAGFLGFCLAELVGLWEQRRGKRELPENGQDSQLYPVYLTLSLFFGTVIVSALFSHYPKVSLLSALAYIFLVFVIFRAVRYCSIWKLLQPRQVVLALAGGTLLASLWALYSYFFQGYSRAELPLIGFNGLGAMFVLVAGPLLGYLHQPGTAPVEKAGLMVVLALLMAALGVTFTRGAWLGLILLVVVFYLPQKKAKLKFLAILLLLCLVVGTVPPLRERFVSGFLPMQNQDRLFIWQAALRMIEDRPLTGVGVGAFPFEYKNYKDPLEPRESVPYAHNLFLAVASEAGLPALFFFTLFLGLFLWQFYAKARRGGFLLWGFFASIMGELLHHLVDIIIWGAHGAAVFWAWLAVGLYWPERHLPGGHNIEEEPPVS